MLFDDLILMLIGMIGGYAFGSIPFGLVLTRLAGLDDIRKIGSGNIGATNVLRTGRKDLAFLTLLTDSGKGAFAVFIFGLLSPWMAMGSALGSVIGHLYPVWLKFKGGKGVATTLGVLLALVPMVGVLTCATWLIMAAAFRFSSLSALVAIALAPFFTHIIYGGFCVIIIAMITVLVFIKHKDNIRRLIKGTEPKIGEKK